MCSHCLFPVVVTSLEQVVITLLYKVNDGNRLATSCSNKNKAVPNKLLRACCHYQLVSNLLHADGIRLVGTTCCESVGLINLATR
jgi:hypothetical protein